MSAGRPSVSEFRRFQSRLLFIHRDKKRYEKRLEGNRHKQEELDRIGKCERDIWGAVESAFRGDKRKVERFRMAWEKTLTKKNPHKETLYEEYLKLTPEGRGGSNEAAIRNTAKEFLSKRFPNRMIRDEFTQWMMVTRPDFIMVDKDDRDNPIIAVEVKSDRDTFDRLYRQLTEFESFATSSYVAIDAKHFGSWIRKFSNRFPRVGVLVYEDGEIEEVTKAHPSLEDSTDWLGLLLANELKRYLAGFRGRSKIPGNIHAIKEVIRATYTHLEVSEIARRMFLHRIATGEVLVERFPEMLEEGTRQRLFDAAIAALDRKTDMIDRERLFGPAKKEKQ